jgi:hypothetical protein
MKRTVLALLIAGALGGAAAWILASQPAKSPEKAAIDVSAGKVETWTIDGIGAAGSTFRLTSGQRFLVKGSIKTDFKRWAQSLAPTKGFRESKAERLKRLKQNPPELQVWVLFVRGTMTGEKIVASSLTTSRLKPDGTCTFGQYSKCPEQVGEYEVRLAITEYDRYAYRPMLEAPRHVIATAKAFIDGADDTEELAEVAKPD